MQKHIDSLVDENLTLNAVVGTQQGVTEEAHQTATRLKRHFTREVDCLRNDLDAAERNRIFLTERLRSLEVKVATKNNLLETKTLAKRRDISR